MKGTSVILAQINAENIIKLDFIKLRLANVFLLTSDIEKHATRTKTKNFKTINTTSTVDWWVIKFAQRHNWHEVGEGELEAPSVGKLLPDCTGKNWIVYLVASFQVFQNYFHPLSAPPSWMLSWQIEQMQFASSFYFCFFCFVPSNRFSWSSLHSQCNLVQLIFAWPPTTLGRWSLDEATKTSFMSLQARRERFPI